MTPKTWQATAVEEDDLMVLILWLILGDDGVDGRDLTRRTEDGDSPTREFGVSAHLIGI